MKPSAHVSLALTSLAIFALLAGCASADIPTPVGTTPGQISPSHSAAPSAVTTVPGLLANGDCSELLRGPELAKSLSTSGGSAHASGDPLFAVIGGLDCTYYLGPQLSADSDDEETDGSGSVVVAIVPSAVAQPSIVAASLAQPVCDSVRTNTGSWGHDCRSTATVAGWWYTLRVHVYDSSTPKTLRANFALVAEQLESTLSAATAPTSVGTAPRFDCAAVNTGGLPVRAIRETADIGDHWQLSEIEGAVFLRAGATSCTFLVQADGESEERELIVYPNELAAYDQCLHSVASNGTPPTPVNIPGVKLAFDIYHLAGLPVICATDGATVIKSWAGYYSESANDQSYLDQLGALLVPVFEAASVYPAPAISSEGTAVSAPTATSQPAPVSPPAGGECKKLLDPAALSSALGLSSKVLVALDDTSLAAVGGMSCRYAFGKRSLVDPEVQVIVAPASIAESEEVASSLLPPVCVPNDSEFDFGGTGCTSLATVNGWWYGLYVTPFKNMSAAKLTGAFDSVKKNLEKSLAKSKGAPHVDVVQPVDCASINVDGLAVESIGRGGWTFYSDGIRPGAEIGAAAFLTAGAVTCQVITKDGAQWRLTINPGTTVPYEQCTVSDNYTGVPEGGPIAVAGVASAFGLTSDYSGSTACATNGTSSVLAYRVLDEPQAPKSWSAKMRGTLSSLLVPVFAATQ
jgi:hypothetical protein